MAVVVYNKWAISIHLELWRHWENLQRLLYSIADSMALTLTGNGSTALYIRSIAFHIQMYACCWIWTDLNILAYPFILPEKKKLIIKRSSFYYSLCKWIDSFILEIFPFRMSLTRLTAYISTWVSKWYSIEIWSVCIFEIRVSFVFGVNTSFLCFFALTIGLMQTEIDTFCDAKLRWYRLKGKGGLFVYDISKERHVIFF